MKSKLQFVCGECGAEHPRWQGQCAGCGVWNSLKEFQVGPGKREVQPGVRARPVPLAEISGEVGRRLKCGLGELDRVLGGGLVPGSAVLIGGDPGIGKSTLLLEVLSTLSHSVPVLYVSGEESLPQLKMRADRMGLPGAKLLAVTENSLEGIEAAVVECSPAVLVVDSIQTVATEAHSSGAGTVSQVRECAARLINSAKRRGMALFLVGHVTKEGQLAGPRVLEHMVDTVLYFEGERGHDYRILRAVKNRFGAANEIGVFAMGEKGLKEVPNPSELFLSERVKDAAGSVVFAGMEGTRPLLVEIQALAAPSPLAQPRRTTLGWDANRLAMLIAVLDKRVGLGLYDRDIFLNIAGGLRISEPAADLAVAMALVASHRNIAVDGGLVLLGEVGLSGEVRAVAHLETRLREAAKLGFTRCILPKKSHKGLTAQLPIEVTPVSSVAEAVARLAK